ncbi:MAG: ACP S-malonyltransferase [Armatimonadota bacterium]|nr:MAG: ACP S-malonyltransferase [Armatimonadota bacterium]
MREGPAFLFPGQGSQRPGMGRDVYERWEAARAVFDEVSQAAGFDVAAACFEESGQTLESTAAVQPAMLAVELGCAAVLDEAGVEPAAAAGHSLGEFAAWTVCGAMTRADVASLVALRGRAMEEAAQRRPGAMAAILGLEHADVEAVCADASGAGVVVLANFNCPGQVVISGDRAAVQEAIRLAARRGGKARALPVAGAFHSPLMAPAAERFAEALGEVKVFDPAPPAAANATGDWVRSAAEVRAAAAAQMTSPVLWENCVGRLLDQGIRRFYEVGPGNVLAGLMRRIEPGAEVIPAGDDESLRRITG